MKKLLLTLLVVIIGFSSCVDNSNKRVPGQAGEEFEGTLMQGVKRIYNAQGKLETEIPYKDSLPNGIQKEYYKTGQLFRETPLLNGKPNGIVKEFSTNGKIYREMPVTNGKANGIIKKYYENGSIFSEAPFVDGQAVAGLKEYSQEGKLLDKPKIVFNAKNFTKIDGSFILELSFSDKYIQPEYCQILVFEGKELQSKLPVEKGKGIFKMNIPAGSTLNKVLTFEAKYKTSRGNICIIRDSFNVSLI